MKKSTFVVFYVDQLAHLLVCLVCWETMTIKNFVGKTGLVVARWTGMKTKGLNKEFLKKYFFTQEKQIILTIS